MMCSTLEKPFLPILFIFICQILCLPYIFFICLYGKYYKWKLKLASYNCFRNEWTSYMYVYSKVHTLLKPVVHTIPGSCGYPWKGVTVTTLQE